MFCPHLTEQKMYFRVGTSNFDDKHFLLVETSNLHVIKKGFYTLSLIFYQVVTSKLMAMILLTTSKSVLTVDLNQKETSVVGLIHFHILNLDKIVNTDEVFGFPGKC